MKGFRAYLQGCRPMRRRPRSSRRRPRDVPLRRVAAGAGLRLQDGPRADAAVRRLLPLPVRARSRATSASWPTTRASTAASEGREVLVSGNFFNLDPISTSRWPTTSTWSSPRCATRRTGSRPGTATSPASPAPRTSWSSRTRTAASCRSWSSSWSEGKGYDLLPAVALRGAALGANMSVPYGAWMGSTIEDSFYAAARPVGRDPDVPGRPRGAVQAAHAPRGRRRLQRREHPRR